MDASFDGGISKRAVSGTLGLQYSRAEGTDELSVTPVGLERFAVTEASRARTARQVN
jgi:hypothetical protein